MPTQRKKKKRCGSVRRRLCVVVVNLRRATPAKRVRAKTGGASLVHPDLPADDATRLLDELDRARVAT